MEKLIMKEKIWALIAEKSAVNENDINGDDTLMSIGIDSLKMVELIISLEENLMINFGEADLEPAKLQKVSDILELIEKYTN